MGMTMMQLTVRCNCPFRLSSSLTNFNGESLRSTSNTFNLNLPNLSGDAKLAHGSITTKFRNPKPAVAAAAEAIAAETTTESEKLGVVVKPMEKPRLMLKFIWMEKNIGIGLDQVIPGYGTIPISPYYFWPRKDAWEELKNMLENKPWISQKQVIILLNQATDIINLWQQSGGDIQ